MNVWDVFYFSCNAILPIVLLVVLGYFLKRLKVFDDAFLNKANSIVFKIFLPFLLFSNIAFIEKDTFASINWSLLIYSVLAIIALFIIGLVIVIFFVKNDKQKGVVLSCVFRSNYAIIGIPLCEFLAVNMNASDKAVAVGLATLMAAVSVPLFNTLAVVSLSVFDKSAGNKIEVKKILKKIITNPLIIGVFTGLVALGLRMLLLDAGLPLTKDVISSNFLYKAIKNVASIASPLALVVLGGRFKFSSVKTLAPQITLGTILRLVFVPAICLTFAYIFGFRELEFPTLVALFATPVAVSSAPMASEMKQDGELADQFVVWTSLLSIVSLFAVIMICSSIGLFVI